MKGLKPTQSEKRAQTVSCYFRVPTADALAWCAGETAEPTWDGH